MKAEEHRPESVSPHTPPLSVAVSSNQVDPSDARSTVSSSSATSRCSSRSVKLLGKTIGAKIKEIKLMDGKEKERKRAMLTKLLLSKHSKATKIKSGSIKDGKWDGM